MEMFEYAFMQRAFIVGVLLALIIPLIGVTVVLRRLSMLGDALSHTSLAGVAAGLLLNVNPVFGASVFCVGAAFGIEGIRRRFPRYAELSISVMLSAGVGLAGVLSGFTKNAANFNSFLFGSIVAISDAELYSVAAVSLLVLLASVLLYKELFSIALDERAARLSGVPVNVVSTIFTLLTAVTVAIAARTVGALIVSSMMVLPVACAMQLAKSYRGTVWASIGFAELFTVAGLVIAYYCGLKPGGTITYLGTPQTEQSLYNQLPDRGYAVRVWPARYPSDDQIINYGSERLAPFILKRLEDSPTLVGRTTDPRRFSDDDLLERELSYGRSGFQLQFMLDTRLSDMEKYPLKLGDLIVMSCSATDAPEKPIWAAGTTNILNDVPCVGLNGDSRYYGPAFLHGTWLPYTGSVMAIDPAGRGKDETAVCVVKMLNGYLYVTAMRAYQEGYSEATLSSIVQLAKQQSVNHVIIEANFGDGMFTKLISPYFTKAHPCRIEEVKHSKQKEARIIDTLEPVMNQHKLVIDKNLILWDYNLSTKNLPPETALKYQLMYQMSRITRDRGSLAHDDRLDSLAMAVGYWVEQMGQDVDKRMLLRQDHLMLEEMKAWEGNAKGVNVKIGITNNPALSEMLFTFHGTVVKGNDDTGGHQHYKRLRNWTGGGRGTRKILR